MENTVYISDVDKKESKIKGYSKLLFKIYDKNGETDLFSTSTMSDYNLEKYIEDASKVLETKSIFKNKFGVTLKSLTTIKDDKENIVGLSRKTGTLLKSEVKQKDFVASDEMSL